MSYFVCQAAEGGMGEGGEGGGGVGGGHGDLTHVAEQVADCFPTLND